MVGLMSYVSFYCPGDHRDLPSFPTRRSSDLLAFFGHSQGSTSGEIAMAWSDAAPAAIFSGAGAYLTDSLLQDRKSTRLNSSHPSISYAVFCLKKKKNPIRPPFAYDIYLSTAA